MAFPMFLNLREFNPALGRFIELIDFIELSELFTLLRFLMFIFFLFLPQFTFFLILI